MVKSTTDKLAAELRNHLTIFDQWTSDLNCFSPGGKLEIGHWIDAANKAYEAAGGLTAFRTALLQQRSMECDGGNFQMAQRLATARYIQEGGLDAELQSVKAYCAASVSDASLPANRKWRANRRKLNRKLQSIVRLHTELCREMSWADTIQFIGEFYLHEKKNGNWYAADIIYARNEVRACIGIQDGLMDILGYDTEEEPTE